ncbi:MAG TPA: cyclic pyranopterin monophosphate synthase MoaC [Acidimicrobiales bacterium]|nr:cyclic pyranopterin monophosphate synthase MoaC [Acidimicrobiales bacterium]
MDKKGEALSGSNDELSHVDENGKAQMVDVGNKDDTKRSATASGKVFMSTETLEALERQELKKGDVLGVARVAGIQAAKKTSELIPLCHPLAINFASVDFRIRESCVEIQATVKTSGKTGVEMEALTACSVAALTVYDMCKSMDKSITIEEVKLLEKTGGKSGDWHRTEK